MTITAQDILDLIKQGERISLEIKECKNSLPKSLWETYSAFANTRGGIILLGITEDTKAPLKDRFKISGVNDAYKIRTDLFNILNNRQKVSRSILSDSDVRTVEVAGRDVVYINVPEADYHNKPIYINNDLQNGTYKRTHEGDRHVDMEGLAMLMRDAVDDIDSEMVDHYDMQDVDPETLRKYRQVFNDSNPNHSYKTLSDKDFLIRMGGYTINRHDEKEGLTRAGLLMFGKSQSIHEVFTAFRVDYLNLTDISKGDSLKWKDRLTDDGRWEDNLYNFASLVMDKLLFSLPSEGRLHGTIRIDGGPLHEGIREGLINCITYCDFMLNGVLRVDRRTDCIIFRNPGLLRIDAKRIYDGDFTNARNRTIQRMFRMVGYGDNIGSGFQKILAAWKSLGYSRPELKDLDDVKEVWLTLPLHAPRREFQIDDDYFSADGVMGVSDYTAEYHTLKESPSNTAKNNSPSVNNESNNQRSSDLISVIDSLNSLSKIQKDILKYMVSNPKSSMEKISKELNEKVETIRYQRRLMSDIVKTEKSGSNKAGTWLITIIP